MLRSKQKGRTTFRPSLEVLEGRLTPTTNFHWKGGHIGNPTDWDDGRNWVDDSGVAYSRSRYPGTISDEDVAIFDSATATTDCDFSSTDGPLAGMSSDANFAFNVNLNGNLTVDGELILKGGTYYVNGTFTTDSKDLLTFNVNLVVSSGNTLVANGDFAYTWNGDTSQHNSLVVDGPTLTIDGGGTVQLAQSAFFPNKGKLLFTARGTTDATFIGNGGEVWFDSGVLQSSNAGGTRSFNMVFEGLSVELSRASSVNLGVVTDAQGNSQWAGIKVLLLGADGGYFFVDTTANDNVTLNMDANAKPTGSSHTLIYAEVSLTGFVNNGTDFIFQKFTKSGEWQAWINHECDDGNDFVLTW